MSDQLAAVLRGGKILTGADGALPTESEAEEHLVLVGTFRSHGFIVADSSTGEPPDDWSWRAIVDVQAEMSDSECSRLGRALTCAEGARPAGEGEGAA